MFLKYHNTGNIRILFNKNNLTRDIFRGKNRFIFNETVWAANYENKQYL